MTTSPPRGIGWTDYRRFCASLGQSVDESLSPAGRAAALPPWVCLPMLATAAARQKARAYREAAPLTRAEVFATAALIGDEQLAWRVAGLLAERIPPPVTAYVVERVTIYATADRLGVLGFVVPSSPSRPWVVALGGTPETFDELAAHELSHIWLLPEPTPGAEAPSAFRSATLGRTLLEHVPAAARDIVVELRALADRDECQARALVKAWGLGGEL